VVDSDDDKRIKGTFQKCRAKKKLDIEPSVPECPQWLQGDARDYWQSIVPSLVKMDIINKLDFVSIALHCDSFAKFKEVSQQLDSIEKMTTETPNGMKIQSAFFQIRSKLFDQVLSSSNSLGLNPKSRQKIGIVGKKKDSENQWDTF
jgi:P27 family predicted phage terminase small subunit